MKIKKISSAVDIPSEELEDWGIPKTIGEPVEIKGGDVLFFPENSKGTWEIIETVRKAYLIYDITKGK